MNTILMSLIMMTMTYEMPKLPYLTLTMRWNL